MFYGHLLTQFVTLADPDHRECHFDGAPGGTADPLGLYLRHMPAWQRLFAGVDET